MITLQQTCKAIREDWARVSPCALPYLEAMEALESVHDTYGLDRGRDMVAYFLCNASTWKGEKAREIKKQLNAMIK